MKIKRSLSENTSCVSRSESTMSVRSLPGESPRRKFMKNTPILNMPFTYQQIVQKVDQQVLCHFLSENDFESDICKRIDKLRHDSP